MKTLELTKATSPLSQYAEAAGDEPVVVVSRGKPMAAVISLKGMDLESAAVSLSPKFHEIIKRSRTRQALEGGLTVDEVRRRLGLKPKARKRKRSS